MTAERQFFRPSDVTSPAPDPGKPPYTRGIRSSGYGEKLWTMRQYAGFGTASETNARFRQLLAAGQTGLSMAFDLPTQMGLDSDDPLAFGEVGRVGVAIDSIEDMDVAFAGLPLDKVTTSMTINAPASLLLLLYELSATSRGIPASSLGGTIQNDILKEFIARGTYIYPARQSIRLVVDTIEYALSELPRWNPVSISGYHMREAGATAAQELGFTLANAICYVDACVERGLPLPKILPRLTFFFNVSNTFLEEVAKFRAARTLWADIVKERFHVDDDRARMLRCHAQTSGATLTAQQPLNNVVRVALQSLAAVLGGVQSLHANAFDEALALPSAAAAEIALRTQQIIASETGIPDFADPLGGSYELEHRTEQLVEEARALIARVDAAGGAVRALEEGIYQREIADAAYEWQRGVDAKRNEVVGVNVLTETVQDPVETLSISPDVESAQRKSLEALRKGRSPDAVERSLRAVREAAKGSGNILPAFREALASRATIGEISSVLREEFGVYEEVLVL